MEIFYIRLSLCTQRLKLTAYSKYQFNKLRLNCNFFPPKLCFLNLLKSSQHIMMTHNGHAINTETAGNQDWTEGMKQNGPIDGETIGWTLCG